MCTTQDVREYCILKLANTHKYKSKDMKRVLVFKTYSVLSAGSAFTQWSSYGSAQFPLLSFACRSDTKQHMAARRGQLAKLSTTASASDIVHWKMRYV